jgi:hypothetical protein
VQSALQLAHGGDAARRQYFAADPRSSANSASAMQSGSPQ